MFILILNSVVPHHRNPLAHLQDHRIQVWLQPYLNRQTYFPYYWNHRDQLPLQRIIKLNRIRRCNCLLWRERRQFSLITAYLLRHHPHRAIYWNPLWWNVASFCRWSATSNMGQLQLLKLWIRCNGLYFWLLLFRD